ncbi:hypothetical protein F4X90_18660 [Candidatus Poribacteria bacterium]|nr:hypothetical protein [Candidatus Poribacteria bacterium]
MWNYPVRVLPSAIGEPISEADVSGDGVVNVLDLVQVENHIRFFYHRINI